MIGTEHIMYAAGAISLLEAAYLFVANVRRLEQVAGGFFFALASLVIFAAAGKINPEGIAAGISDWLFALAGPFLPFSWFVLTLWWGRDVAAERRLFPHAIGLFICFAISLVLVIAAGAEPLLRFVADDPSSRHFELSSFSFLLTLFTLITTLIGLFNIESTIRSAVGSQRQKLGFGFTVLLIIAGVVQYLASIELLYEQIPLWAIIGTACLLPLIGLAFILSLRHYDPSQLGIVVSRRLRQTSVVIVAGGGFIVVLGLIDSLVESFGTTADIVMPVLGAALVGFFFAGVFAMDLMQGRALRDKPFEPLANSELLREFVEDIATSASLDDIVGKAGAYLKASHGITKCALISAEGNDSFLIQTHQTDPRAIQSNHIAPIAEWLHRYGLPISFDDFCERSAVSQEHCRFCTTALGFAPTVLVPLICRKRLVGMLVTGETKDGHTDFRELIDFMEVVASPLSLAVQNCRVTDELIAAKELESCLRVSEFVGNDLSRSISFLERMALSSTPATLNATEFSDELRRLRRVSSKLMPALTEKWVITDFDVSVLLKKVLQLSGAQDNRHIAVRERLTSGCMVKGDAQRLAFVFDSLISNALEAMPSNGSLVVSTEKGVGEDDRPFVRITIADSGVGMTADFIESKLFRPFSGTKSKGLGVSMYQVREIVRHFGGSIRVESDPGRGTSMYVIIPA